MNGTRLDRIARQLARDPLSRRVALQASSLGVAAAMTRRVGLSAPADHGDARRREEMPAAQSTPSACPAAPASEVAVDGAWLCRQPYALCTTALCERSSSDPTIATCRCVVLDGYSIGFTTCPARTPAGKRLVSTFSTQNVTSAFGVLTCPEDIPWANCLDMPCELDPLNPALATCQCQLVGTGPSFTFGGGCDARTCSSVIWSAASPPGVTQYAAAMRCVNQPVSFPATCPSATPVASPSGTPGSDSLTRA
jgi:hypothetical protein